MEKTTTLNLRFNPDVKRRAEEVLSQLGMPMSTAIDIYLKHCKGVAFKGLALRLDSEMNRNQAGLFLNIPPVLVIIS